MSSQGDRPPSATSHQTVQSHHTTMSERTGSQSHQSQGGRPQTVVVQDNGIDQLDRYDLMFTGPDGLRHQRVSTRDCTGGYVGEGARSGEMTSSLGYMFRTPLSVPFPRAKHGRLGEIGSEVDLWNLKKGI